jgi:hypothetical protein
LVGKVALVQVSGIPIQQNTAEVEDDGLYVHEYNFTANCICSRFLDDYIGLEYF